MNINTLMLLVAIVLGSIYVFFKPFVIEQASQTKVPQIELYDYLLFEFDTQKLATIAYGKKAQVYSSRNILYDFVFNNNEKEKISVLTADRGIQKKDTINLKGKVLYADTDMIDFESEHAFYNKRKKYVLADVPYTAHMNENRVKGTLLYYDIANKRIKSKNVDAIYKLNE